MLIALRNKVYSLKRWHSERKACLPVDMRNRKIALGDYVHSNENITVAECGQFGGPYIGYDNVVRQYKVKEIHTSQHLSTTRLDLNKRDW